MMKNLIKQNKYSMAFIFVVFTYFALIAYLTPLSGDDWTWGSSTAISWLNNWFDGYNGRYAGNLFVMLLTRIGWLRVLLKALLITLLILLMVKQGENRTKNSYLLAFILILLIPVNIFQQTISWTAGFANYVPATIAVIVFFILIKDIFKEKNCIPNYRNWSIYLFAIPFLIISQLFIENITLYFVASSILVMIYTFIKYKKIFMFHFIMLISTIAGALIMFSNSAYSSIANGNDEYSARTITVASESTNMFKYAFDVYSEQMYRLLFMNNTFLNILLSIVCLIIINKSSKKTFKTSLLILFVSYSLYKPIVIDMLQVNIFGNYTNEFEAIYSILFFIGLVLTVFIYIDVPVLKNKILWYLLSILILSGPLLYAQPFGPRNFFTQYILFSIIVIELIYYIRSYLKIKLEPQVIRKTLIVSSIIVMSVYIFAFVQIRVSANERLEIIKQNLENNETQIQISKLPYSQFIWRGDPSQQQIRFKNLYKIPRDVELIEINYNDWIKK